MHPKIRRLGTNNTFFITLYLGNKMKYGIFFFIIATTAGLYAFQYPNVSVLLGWVTISVMNVAISYFGILPNAFFKRSNGVIPLWSKILNIPFLLNLSAVWHLQRLISRESFTNRVSNNLVIGRRLLPKEIKEEFDRYVDLTAEFDEPKSIREKSSYVCFPILDTSVPKIEDLVNLLCKIENKKLFLHCAKGHGRTGLVAIALLLKNGTIKDVCEGIKFLQRFRPALNLNQYQIKYLERNKERLTKPCS